MKKFIAIMLSMLIVFSATAMMGFAADVDTITSFAISSLVEVNDSAPTVEWFLAEDGNYYLFVPTSISTALCKVSFEAGGEVKIDGEKVENGSMISLNGKTAFDVSCGLKTYNVKIIEETELASIFITTASGSLDAIHADKEHKEEGYIKIIDANGLTSQYDGDLEYIKGRGNSTWKMEKKPYNLKLDKKADLFGMGKSKKWSLIANHSDTSLMRNAIIYSVAGEVLEYTPKYTPVDLYINNDYMGSYILTTRVEVGDNRVEIENLDDANEDANPDVDFDSLPLAGTRGQYSGLMEGTQKWVEIPNDPEDISGGYLMEMEIADRYDSEISGFVSDGGQPVIFKNPEYATENEVKYISGVYQNFEDAVMAENGTNENGDYYTALCDIITFQKFYAINEWASNMDCGLTSTYLYKPQGDDKLYAGPVWDFDIAFGNNSSNRYGCNYMNPEEFTVCFGRQYKNTIFGQADVKKVPTLFNALCQKEDFVAGVKTVWDNEIVSVINEMNATELDAYAAKIEGSAVANAIRWNIYGTTNVDEIKEKFKADVDFVKDFSTKRAAFLTENFGTVQKQKNANRIENLINAILGGLGSMNFDEILNILSKLGDIVGGLLGGFDIGGLLGGLDLGGLLGGLFGGGGDEETEEPSDDEDMWGDDGMNSEPNDDTTSQEPAPSEPADDNTTTDNSNNESADNNYNDDNFNTDDDSDDDSQQTSGTPVKTNSALFKWIAIIAFAIVVIGVLFFLFL